MSRLYRRTRAMRSIGIAIALAVLSALLSAGSSFAHEGHDHGAETKAAPGAPTSPRVVATSENYQLVGIVEGEVLVIYLDRADDNSPVTTAAIEVSLDGEPFKAELQEKTGTYEVTAPLLRKPGSHEVLVNLAEGGTSDLLVGTLRFQRPAASGSRRDRSLRQIVVDALAAWPAGRTIASSPLVSCFLLRPLAGRVLSGRRKLYIVPAAIIGLLLASRCAWAHEGHDHGPDLSASAGNSPSRRPDGSIFVPKPDAAAARDPNAER